MMKEFPLVEFRDRSNEVEKLCRGTSDFSKESLNEIFEVSGEKNIEAQHDSDFIPRVIKISGFGGQGVMSMGLTLAQAAYNSRRYVSFYPAYGPEQRGGTSDCTVVISGETINLPTAHKSDLLVALNEPSLEKFADRVKKGGIILYDTELGGFKAQEDVKMIRVPAVRIAKKFGVVKAANTAMLGVIAQIQSTGLSQEVFKDAIKHTFSKNPKLIQINLEILNAGSEWARENLN